MWTVLFIITTFVCSVGWLSRYISCAAMIYYMEKNQYRLPNDVEIRECTEFVTNHIIKDFFK